MQPEAVDSIHEERLRKEKTGGGRKNRKIIIRRPHAMQNKGEKEDSTQKIHRTIGTIEWERQKT
jgi:hypothetical protein